MLCGLKDIAAENSTGLPAAVLVLITATTNPRKHQCRASSQRLSPKSRVALAREKSRADSFIKHHPSGGAGGYPGGGGMAAKPPKVRLSLPNPPTQYPEESVILICMTLPNSSGIAAIPTRMKIAQRTTVHGGESVWENRRRYVSTGETPPHRLAQGNPRHHVCC